MTTKIYPLNDTEYQSITEFEGASTYEVVTAIPKGAVVFTSLEDYKAKTEYVRKRKDAYNELNQFELISDDAINGTTTHKDAIVAIKSEFPKL